MTRQIGWPWPLAIMLVSNYACGDDTAIVVTVDARPQVLDAVALEVTATNEGDSETQVFSLGADEFPVTFSVTPAGRSGDLQLDVLAVDDASVARGVATITTPIEPNERVDVDLVLDPADFVVNTSTTGSQKPVFRNGRNGRQLGVAADGSFAVSFVDDCSQSEMECNIYGRLFDQQAAPRVNDTGGNADEFQVNLEDQVFGSVPAIAVGDNAAAVAFELFSDVMPVDDIRAVVLSDTGAAVAGNETVVVSGAALRPSDPDVAALASGEFVVVWSQIGGGGREIRGRLIDSTGAPVVNGITGDALDFAISTTVGVDFANPNVFATGNDREFAVVWEGEDNVFMKFFDNAGLERSNDLTLTAFPSTGTVFGPKIHVLAGDSAIVAWGVHVIGDVELERGAFQIGKFSSDGTEQVSPVTIAGPLLEVAPDPAAMIPPFGSPALAGRAGEVAVAWEQCLDADLVETDCDVLAMRFDEELVAIGEPTILNSTRERDQISPSIEVSGDGYVAVWTDESLQAPDTSLAAVRARLVFFSEP